MTQTEIDFTPRGATYDPELDKERLGAQLIRVRDCMVDEQWRIFDEMSADIYAATGFRDPAPSLSARLRDMRRMGWTVERRRRGDGRKGLFEYRVTGGPRE